MKRNKNSEATNVTFAASIACLLTLFLYCGIVDSQHLEATLCSSSFSCEMTVYSLTDECVDTEGEGPVPCEDFEDCEGKDKSCGTCYRLGYKQYSGIAYGGAQTDIIYLATYDSDNDLLSGELIDSDGYVSSDGSHHEVRLPFTTTTNNRCLSSADVPHYEEVMTYHFGKHSFKFACHRSLLCGAWEVVNHYYGDDAVPPTMLITMLPDGRSFVGTLRDTESIAYPLTGHIAEEMIGALITFRVATNNKTTTPDVAWIGYIRSTDEILSYSLPCCPTGTFLFHRVK